MYNLSYPINTFKANTYITKIQLSRLTKSFKKLLYSLNICQLRKIRRPFAVGVWSPRFLYSRCNGFPVQRIVFPTCVGTTFSGGNQTCN